MANICTLDDLNKNTKNKPVKLKHNTIIKSKNKQNVNTNLVVIFLLQILECIFICFRFLKKSNGQNNIMKIYETVELYKNNTVVSCNAILDTGNESITIVSKDVLNKLGYTDNDYNSYTTIEVYGIGGLKKMHILFIHYSICGFYHEGFVGISSDNLNDIANKYDMIVSQKDMSKMFHSGYKLFI